MPISVRSGRRKGFGEHRSGHVSCQTNPYGRKRGILAMYTFFLSLSMFEINLKRTHRKETFFKMSRSCCWEQFKFCVSAGSSHLAPFIPCERTSRVHCRAHADWVFSASSPFAACNASTVHSSSAAAQELVSFTRGIALNKEVGAKMYNFTQQVPPPPPPPNEWCIHKLCPADKTRFLQSSRSDALVVTNVNFVKLVYGAYLSVAWQHIYFHRTRISMLFNFWGLTKNSWYKKKRRWKTLWISHPWGTLVESYNKNTFKRILHGDAHTIIKRTNLNNIECTDE